MQTVAANVNGIYFKMCPPLPSASVFHYALKPPNNIQL